LLGAVALLLATNAVGHGKLSLSPYGSTFLLARLVANGPAIRTIEARCPEAGWALCAFEGRLAPYGPEGCSMRHCPRELLPSDIFLWDPASPVNRDEAGRPRDFGGRALSGEAREIVRETVMREPFAVAWDAVWDTLRQMATNRVGDTLERRHIGEGVRSRIEAFGPEESARFQAGAQWRDAMRGLVAPFLWIQGPVLAMGVAALALLGWLGRRDRVVLGLALGIGIAILANAFATGALSGPHDRYGARLAWLVVAGAVALGMRRQRAHENAPEASPLATADGPVRISPGAAS